MGVVIFKSKPASQEDPAAAMYSPSKQILFAASVSLLIGGIGTSYNGLAKA
jgi:hypothetical protein